MEEAPQGCRSELTYIHRVAHHNWGAAVGGGVLFLLIRRRNGLEGGKKGGRGTGETGVDRCTAHVGLISVHITCPFKLLPPHMDFLQLTSLHVMPIPYLSCRRATSLRHPTYYYLFTLTHASKPNGSGFAASMSPHPS